MNLHQAAQQLAALATGLCQDAGIGLEVTERNWAWDPVRRVILVAGPDLEQKGPDYCAGVLAHEVSHFFISRYVWFPVDFPSTSVLFFLLNGIEDPRVNTWIRQRYPGTAAWLRAVGNADMHDPQRPPLPDVLAFGFEAAREEWLGWEPACSVGTLHPRLVEALDRTRAARRAYAEKTLPRPDLDPAPLGSDLARRYSTEVWPRLSHDAPRSLPSAREQAVRLKALEAMRLAEAEILPVARELMEGDIARLTALLQGDRALQRTAGEAARSGNPQVLQEIFVRALDQAIAAEAPPASEGLRKLSMDLIESWLNGWRGGGRASPLLGPGDSREGEGKGGDGRPAPPPPKPPLRLPAGTSAYDRALAQVASQIDLLTRHIEDVLRPVRRLREGRDFPSGSKLNMRRVMAWEADPRLYDKLWLRKTIPGRRGTAMSLLVDLSGSMRGEKAEAALAGTILVSEVLARLGVPFAVNGFQDVLIPFCDFGEGLTSEVRNGLGQLPGEVDGTRSGGNNQPLYNDDGPCLLEAAEGLLERSETDRVLIVVSDGRPEGRRSNEADLRRAIGSLRALGPELTLVGLGLGPGTDHVSRFYPESIANIPVARFADEIGGLLQRTLLGAGRI